MRLSGKVQRPVAGFPVIDAAKIKLRQRAQHGLSGGRNQKRPICKLGGRKFTSFPDFTRRIYQQVATIFAADQSCALIGQGQMSTSTAKKYPSQGCSLKSQRSRF